ncbi:MAG TPA: hypothetical protein VM388_10260 [Acidimicrobiales bacterium]|nr:hypothetical protein [Acidimicrobiales bacterium]
MALEEVVDEHFLNRYRALLDAEDAAFDELEHAYEDGDREHYLADLQLWERCVERRVAFLTRHRVLAQSVGAVT